MRTHLLALLIGLLFGGLAGYMFAASGDAARLALEGGAPGAAPPRHHAGDGHEGHSHGEMRDLPAGPDAPALDLEIAADPDGGWTLHVTTENFRFAPAAAGGAHAPGEGHAHVYAGETKLARIYGPWHHLASVPEGTGSLTVTLTGNDHRPLAVDGEPLAVTRPLPPR